ncbi:hypothetical protein PsorP6_007212 [Peronosclerospora sorghi]|uniref:Uncharacterized protein n=1 Tax=Peronosclerospora sorghi TaxID=230839 RepID=A0ACC0W9W0_9STRA|nr:hypothetical protein PsorP6_007212 [Peronosclerospora sorghi]
MTKGMRYYVRSQRNFQTFKSGWKMQSYPSQLKWLIGDRTGCIPVLTQELGGVVLYGTTLESTQTLLRETLKPAPPAGIICRTELQSSGNGCDTNTLSSPEGCLTFSFQSVFVDGTTLPFVQYLLALAIIKAGETVHSYELGNAGSVRIKWPNDIYANQVKIGGILCQSEYHNGLLSVTTGAFWYIRDLQLCLNRKLSLAGIGINIFNRSPTICLQDVLSTKESPCTVTNLTQERVLGGILQRYLARWLHTDQPVQVANDDEPNGEKVIAIMKGLTSTGCLLAKGDDGSRPQTEIRSNRFAQAKAVGYE